MPSLALLGFRKLWEELVALQLRSFGEYMPDDLDQITVGNDRSIRLEPRENPFIANANARALDLSCLYVTGNFGQSSPI